MLKTTRRTRMAVLAPLLAGAVLGPAAAIDSTVAAAARVQHATARAVSGPAWLAEINRYRAATGLAPVGANPGWDAGIAAHLTYLERTPSSLMTGHYQSAHTENPASPYYTPGGAQEAGFSDLDEGGAPSPLAAVDVWLAAPFHAIGMLRAQLTQVALADDPARGYAGLDVIQGVDSNLPASTAPILFPGPGITTNQSTFGGEYPDPRETCGWQRHSVGLPLIALLPQAPGSGLTASVAGPTGAESSTAGTLCVVDENTFRSTDAVYGPAGQAILQDDNAVILIPRRPLADGRYSVTISQAGQADIAWSFAVQVPVPANRRPPVIRGRAAAAAILSVRHGLWSRAPTAYHDQWMRCTRRGTRCRAIIGQTGPIFSPAGPDVGSTIRVREVASNAHGSGLAVESAPTRVVVAARTR